MEFNKELCLGNIYYLAKSKGIKIRDLEAAAGISTGYLSRLAKEGNSATPSIEALVIFSDILKVSIDALVKKDLTIKDATEKYISLVLERLINDTSKRILKWNLTRLESLEKFQKDWGFPHPFYKMLTCITKNESDWNRFVAPEETRSKISRFNSILPSGDFYWLFLPPERKNLLFITNVNYDNQYKNINEIFMISEEKVEMICSTFDNDKLLKDEIEYLYNSINDDKDIVHMKQDVKNVFDNYLNVEEYQAILPTETSPHLTDKNEENNNKIFNYLEN